MAPGALAKPQGETSRRRAGAGPGAGRGYNTKRRHACQSCPGAGSSWRASWASEGRMSVRERGRLAVVACSRKRGQVKGGE